MICTGKDLVQVRICSGSGTGKNLYRICTGKDLFWIWYK